MKIIYERPDGGVSVVTPIMKLKPKAMTDVQYMLFLALKDVPFELDFSIVSDNSIPSDRTFRGAWKKNGVSIDVDMVKAAEIHMAKIRKVRDRELDKTDKEVSKEVENGVVTKALKDKRQALRDIPQNTDLSVAKTPDELKAIWPTNLPRKE